MANKIHASYWLIPGRQDVNGFASQDQQALVEVQTLLDGRNPQCSTGHRINWHGSNTHAWSCVSPVKRARHATIQQHSLLIDSHATVQSVRRMLCHWVSLKKSHFAFDLLHRSGTMLFGESTPPALAGVLLGSCMEHGCNFFDTAEMYPVSWIPGFVRGVCGICLPQERMPISFKHLHGAHPLGLASFQCMPV